MKLRLPPLPKIDGKSLTRTIFKESAPGLLKGFLTEKLRGVPVLEAHKYLMEHELWEQIPEERKAWLLGMRPWGLEKWMSIDWLYRVIYESNPSLATMMATSPKFREKMEGQLANLIEILDKTVTPE